jgi:hypothetical protein
MVCSSTFINFHQPSYNKKNAVDFFDQNPIPKKSGGWYRHPSEK